MPYIPQRDLPPEDQEFRRRVWRAKYPTRDPRPVSVYQRKVRHQREQRALARLLGYVPGVGRCPRLPSGRTLLDALRDRALLLLRRDDLHGAYAVWAAWQTYRRLWDLKTGRIQLWTGTLDESREG